MREFTGNLFGSDATALGHGVNVDGLMGAGIAKQFAALFPTMHMNYRALCNAKLLMPGEVYVHTTPNLTIYNIASQDRPGRNARLDWLAEGIDAALSDTSLLGHSALALPRIGCGIGGLSWDDVEPLLAEIEARHSTELHIYTI